MKAQHEFDNEKDYKEYLRKYFAAMAMQGILAAQTETGFLEPREVAERAVEQANSLLKQLEQK